jgi:threonylcarbamoyladenosine tRNA methylthiotransferase MtaB
MSGGSPTRAWFQTFGCKANQYDTERMRQELELAGAVAVASAERADVAVVNTCTVTAEADRDARRIIRKLGREHPGLRIVVAGCSAALRGSEYSAMDEVWRVVPGQDAAAVARAARPLRPAEANGAGLVELRGSDRALLTRFRRGTRAWLKVQDGCDRRCSFCATRLARGASRSRDPDELVREALLLGREHPEIVITGIHIGHYGLDLAEPVSLAGLCRRLLDEVPDVRLRLGSIEATEIDDPLVDLLADPGGRLAPHLHVPLQSGSDTVLRRMRRWHTREAYRSRILEIASRLPYLGLGADIITGFPGETDSDHVDSRRLVEELPYTYLHVFPFSARPVTEAGNLPNQVPRRVRAARARDLRELGLSKGRSYRASRLGSRAHVVVETVVETTAGRGPGAAEATGTTEDYLRVEIPAGNGAKGRFVRPGAVLSGLLTGYPDRLQLRA